MAQPQDPTLAAWGDLTAPAAPHDPQHYMATVTTESSLQAPQLGECDHAAKGGQFVRPLTPSNSSFLTHPTDKAVAPAWFAPALDAALEASLLPALTAALEATLLPALTAALNAALEASLLPALSAALEASLPDAISPHQTRYMRMYNRSALQGTAGAPLLALRDPVTGAAPPGFPRTRRNFDALAEPPMTQAKLDDLYR